MPDQREDPISKAKRLRAEREAREAAAVVNHDTDLVPDVGPPSNYEPTAEDAEIDRIVDNLDIITAYQVFYGKPVVHGKGRRKNIMIECPHPGHHDEHPSADIDLDKNLYNCNACVEGGDAIHMIARIKGYVGDSYKQGKAFPDLKREIAEKLGYIVKRTPGGEVYTIAPAEAEVETSDMPDMSGHNPEQSSPSVQPILSVVPDVVNIYEKDDDDAQEEIERGIPRIPWMSILPPDTFWYKWMDIMRHSDLPEEFFFWHGGMAVGLAVGRDAFLDDSTPVTGNFYSCLFGPSGQGKSRSVRPLSELLRLALPHDKHDGTSTGVYHAPMPGSPEALIDLFARDIMDPSDPKIVLGHGAVRGLIRFDELSTLIGRTSRSGNPLKPVLQQFYDADPHIATASRGHGEVEAHNPFASLITTTQPKAIRQVMLATDVDSGFANRFVYVMGHNKAPFAFGGTALDITPCVEPLQRIHSWAAFKRPIGLTPDALARWTEFYREKMDQYHLTDEAIFSRIPLLMKKIMLLLACNRLETMVSVDTVESAILLYPYIESTYAYLSGDLGMGERQELDNAIIESARKVSNLTGRGATPREIMSRLGKRFPRDASTIRRALEDLCALGLLSEETVKPVTGRPTTRYMPVLNKA